MRLGACASIATNDQRIYDRARPRSCGCGRLESHTMDLNPESIAKSPFFIGALGALVGLRGVPGSSWGERAINAASGALLSGFTSPFIANYFGLHGDGALSFAAFVVGLFGLNFVAAFQTWLKGADFADLLPWSKKGAEK